MNKTGALVAEAVARSKTVAEIRVAPGAISGAAELFAKHFGAGPACIVADDNTWAAAGKALEAVLTAAGIVVRKHVLPAKPRPKPSVELADQLGAIIAIDGATPIAVGSGVINDVVKHAAFKLGRPYLCVATAASMDGYTSAGAPLSERGFKKTIQCRPAKVILADLDVIAAAPPEMTSWGYSDLAGKIPAGGDWVAADVLGIEPIDDVAWPMVQGLLREWLSEPAKVAAGELEAIEGLFAGLAMVGLAMEQHGSSRPASGADHQIAHLWEMEGLKHGGEIVSHGACVAIGSVAVLELYDWLLRRGIDGLDIDGIVAAAPTMEQKTAMVRDAFGPGEIAERSIDETRAKHLEPDAHRARLLALQSRWPEMAGRLRQQLMTPADFRSHLKKAGAPAHAADIGVDDRHLHRTIVNARFLRSRYTILDILDEAGLLTEAVDAVVPKGRG